MTTQTHRHHWDWSDEDHATCVAPGHVGPASNGGQHTYWWHYATYEPKGHTEVVRKFPARSHDEARRLGRNYGEEWDLGQPVTIERKEKAG